MKSSSDRLRVSGRNTHGMTLVELMCASTVAFMVLAETIVTFSAVQHSFIASIYQIDAQNDQKRVFSYLRRDLRNATSVQISAQGTQLTLSVPAGITPTMNLNLGAVLLSLLSAHSAPPASKTVRYYRQGTAIIREIDGVATALSASATHFQIEFQGALVRIATGYQPRFSYGKKAASVQASTVVRLLNANPI